MFGMDLDAKSLFLIFGYVCMYADSEVCYAPKKYLYILTYLEDS